MTSGRTHNPARSAGSVALLAATAILTISTSVHAAADTTGGYRGANAWDVFGGNSSAAMASWGINIIREDVPDFNVVPMGNSTIQADGSYLHGLQSVVNQNAASGDTTILCPFTWDGSQILGVTPSQTSYWTAYNNQLAAEAREFSGQSNVWLEVWNEPYAWNTPTQASQWSSDMETMINSIRNGTGFTGKIVIPGGQEAGSVAPIVADGAALEQYDPQHNLIFDVHAYNQWFSTGTTGMESTIQSVQNSGVPMIFGEYGWDTSAGGYNVAPFLQAAQATNVGAIAWNWDDADSDTLHNSDGTLNDTPQNDNWASQVLSYTLGTGRAALPGGWTDADIGAPAIPGNSSFTNATFTVFGSGSDIWNTSDQFNYASRTLAGDGTITAEVIAQQNTDPWAKAGVMFRFSSAADAPFVAVELTPGNGVQMQARTASGAEAIEVGSAGAGSTVWVRLVKTGTSFIGYYATTVSVPNSSDWIEFGSLQNDAFSGTTFLAGLAVSSHSTSSLSTAEFANVTVTPEPAALFLFAGGLVGALQLMGRKRRINHS